MENQYNLDFFLNVPSLRGKNKKIIDMFVSAYQEDKNLALKNLFHLRDIDKGDGERESFRACFDWLAENGSAYDFEQMIKLIPVFGRWDDVFEVLQQIIALLYRKSVSEQKQINLNANMLALHNVISEQIKKDTENMEKGKTISLLAKWFPLPNNRRTPHAIAFARSVVLTMFKTERKARKRIVELRRYLKVLEQKISKNEWNDIDYSEVPYGAMNKYSEAFKEHDSENYYNYLSSKEDKKERRSTTKTAFLFSDDKKVFSQYKPKNYTFINNEMKNIYDVRGALTAYLKLMQKKQKLPKCLIFVSEKINGNKLPMSHIMKAKEMFQKANLEFPQLVFWNSCEKLRKNMKFVQEDIIVYSGFSKFMAVEIENHNNLKDLMISILNSKRYEKINFE